MAKTPRGFGVATALATDVLRATVKEAEALGYHSFWVTDNPQDDGLAALRQAAEVTSTIKLGIGVIPLSLRPPAEIVARIEELGLPLDRLILGVGSGPKGRGTVERVRSGVADLKRALDREIVISALGPNMARLAGEVADGVLFNWLTPDYARTSAGWTRESAQAAGRPTPRLLAYVRTSIGPDGRARLVSEGARYAGSLAYADHFRRMGVAPEETGIAAPTAADVPRLLEAWDGILDEVIVRAITPSDTHEQTLALVRAAAP